MAGVTASVDLSISARLSGTADIGASNYAARISHQLAITAGNGALDRADLLFTDTRTLAASATENLDLAGALASPLGATITAAEVVLIYVEADADNTNDVVIGGAASNTFVGPFGDATDTLEIQPGQAVLLTSRQGWPVTAGTGDILKVANGAAGSSVDYTIVVIARSTAN